VIEDARVQTSFVAAPTTASSPTSVGAGRNAQPSFLVQVDRHRVRTGQTLASIAKEWRVPGEDIALFNWGTTDQQQLDRRYRETLGCTRTSPDGARVVFDDRDEPGVVLIPRPWESRLSIGPVHRIAVAPLRTVFLILRNEVGLALPGSRYEAEFADGSSRAGRLGRSGIARVEGVPEGPFTVSYPDQLEVLATSMAASVRRAFNEQATAPLFTLLMQEQPVIARAEAAYGQYFNDLTGQGLAADIDQVVTDPDARRPLLALCAMAGLAVEGVGGISVENFEDPVDPGTPSIDLGVGR
jgi:hypothetical protein